MLREQLCDIEQRLVCGSGDNTTTFELQNGSGIHLVPPASGTSVLIACDIVS
jgi:hypothetical protein